LNFLGIGPAELIFILVIALIVFGPKRLPEIGRTLGKTMREFRSVSEELTSQLREELETASKEIEAVSEDVKGTLEAASVEVQPASEEAKSELVGSKPIQSAIEDVAGDGLQAAEQTSQGAPDVGALEREPDSERSS